MIRARHRWHALLALVAAGTLAGGAATAGALLRDDERARPPATARPPAPTESSPASADPTTPPSTSPPRDPRRGSGQAVTFAFGGDVHFEGALRSMLQADPEGMLGSIAPVLSAADVAVVNLETAITERGVPEDKQYIFRTPPTALAALGAAGVDAVSLANNHGLDYGADGLADTIAAKEATPSPVVIGVGRNAAEAYSPYRVEVKGQKIAVFAATQVIDGNLIASWTASDSQAGLASAKEVERLAAAVEAVRREVDTVVVYLHWGVEGQQCPSADQQALAQRLVDAGADIVVGGHAHRLQGAGRLGSAVIGYGLGNFVFYNESGPSGVSGVLQVTATGRDIDAYSWAPAVIRGGVPQPLPAGPSADAAVAAWDGLRPCTGLTP